MRAPRRAAASPAAPVLAAVGALLAWAVLAGGADRIGRLAWVGGAAVLLAGGLAAAALLGRLPRPQLDRAALVAVGALAGLVLWQGLSVWWSILPDASWNAVNRGLVYLAFLLIGAVAGALSPRGPRLAAYALAAVLAATFVAALAGKVFAGFVEDYERVARLQWPVGYWNVLALLGVFGLVLGLWLGAEPLRREARAAGALLVYGALVVVALTLSRGGIAVAVLAAVGWLVLDRRRLESLATLAIAGLPAFAVVAVAFSLDGVTSDGQPRSVREDDGLVFALVLLAGAVAVGVAAFFVQRLRAGPRERRLADRAGLAVAAAAVLALAAVAVAGWDEFANPADESTPPGVERFGTASSNFRWEWWQEAWDTWREHPLEGTGAGSFELSHRLLRDERTQRATEPHDLPLQTLSETGLVGFALLVAFVAAAGIAVRNRLRDDEDGTPVVALAVCALAYAVHALVDIDWEYTAVSAPLFLSLGVLVSRPGAAARADPLWSIGAAALAATAVLSLASPVLAQNRLEQALLAADLEQAVERAKEAHSLNPVSVDPLLLQGALEEARGNRLRALQLYRDAVATQPENPTPYIELGKLELKLGAACSAYQHLNHAYTLDRFNLDLEIRGGPLDQARAKVNAGACES